MKGFVGFWDEEEVYLVEYGEGNIELCGIEVKGDVGLYVIVIGKDLKEIEVDL